MQSQRKALTMLESVFNSNVMEYPPQSAELFEPRADRDPKVRLHLMVVETDAAVRSACAEIASSLGFVVQSTADMSQARNLLRGHATDILLINLPPTGNRGLELVSEIKLLYP